MTATARNKRNHLGDRRDGSVESRIVWQCAESMVGRTYRLQIEGELSDLVRSELGATTLRHEHGNTVLEAVIRDQSELQGLLQRISGLGLTLVSVDTVRPGARPGFVPAERKP
jgi:hypothetical protein